MIAYEVQVLPQKEGNERFDARGSSADKKTDSLPLAGAPQEQKETF